MKIFRLLTKHKSRLSSLAIAMLVALMLAACVDDNNTISGETNSGITPKRVIIKDSLVTDSLVTDFYSYQDSTYNFDTGLGNTALLVGFKNGINAYSLIAFDDLPDTTDYQGAQSATLTLYINKNWGLSQSTLGLGLVITAWEQEEATWSKANEETDWDTPGGDFEELSWNNLTLTEDSLYIELQPQVIDNWVNGVNANYGLIVYAQNPDGYMEMYSCEAEDDPTLSFDYYVSVTDSTGTNNVLKTYTESSSDDSFICNAQPLTGQKLDAFGLANINPQFAFIKFQLNPQQFPELNQNDAFNQFARMTVNRAELILHIDPQSVEQSSSNFSLQPCMVKTATPNLPMDIGDDYALLSYTVTTTDSLGSATMRVNITPLVQGITGQDYDNNGIMLRPTQANKDFNSVDFYRPDNPDTSLRPYLDIIYTPPYLDGE